jgi:hypothetical protein
MNSNYIPPFQFGKYDGGGVGFIGRREGRERPNKFMQPPSAL